MGPTCKGLSSNNGVPFWMIYFYYSFLPHHTTIGVGLHLAKTIILVKYSINPHHKRWLKLYSVSIHEHEFRPDNKVSANPLPSIFCLRHRIIRIFTNGKFNNVYHLLKLNFQCYARGPVSCNVILFRSLVSRARLL